MSKASNRTTGRSRFVSAVARLVGKTPPDAAVDEWLAYPEVEPQNGLFELQEWVVCNLPGDMAWAQGIEILDAAQAIAQTPEEGTDLHEPGPCVEDGVAPEWVDFLDNASATEIAMLQDAIEGECGGLAISDQQAKAILSHISTGATSEGAQVGRHHQPISLELALGYADNPEAVSESTTAAGMEEVFTKALRVLAAAYRAALASPCDPAPYAEFARSMEKIYGHCDAQCVEAFGAGLRYAVSGRLPVAGYIRLGTPGNPNRLQFVQSLEYRSAADAEADPGGLLWQEVFTLGKTPQRPRFSVDEPWCELFRRLALELRCLPSSFIDGNEHVFKAAKHAMSVRASDEDRADAARWRKWLPWMRRLTRKPAGLEQELVLMDEEQSAEEAKLARLGAGGVS